MKNNIDQNTENTPHSGGWTFLVLFVVFIVVLVAAGFLVKMFF